MLAREAEEDRKRREEEMAREEAEEAEARRDEGKRKKRGIIIANWTFSICHALPSLDPPTPPTRTNPALIKIINKTCKRCEEEMARVKAEETEARWDEGKRKKRGIITANWTFLICHAPFLP